LFAAATLRPALLGIYALQAEWRALMHPASEPGAALIKLDWWREEIRRLAAGMPVHPIGMYLKSLPRADAVDFAPLMASVEAAAAESGGVPLERGTDLQAHAYALRGAPLMLASHLGSEVDEADLTSCIQALAVAEHLSISMGEYRRQIRFGHISFPVEELMAAGIDNADLAVLDPPDRLKRYLKELRSRAANGYANAAQSLPMSQRFEQRHLLVLSALGAKHLDRATFEPDSARLEDLMLAWKTARRAKTGN
jgi:15-cis-phytoene synthase